MVRDEMQKMPRFEREEIELLWAVLDAAREWRDDPFGETQPKALCSAIDRYDKGGSDDT
jgi:hypothetical protein